jgi:hypothetical protein
LPNILSSTKGRQEHSLSHNWPHAWLPNRRNQSLDSRALVRLVLRALEPGALRRFSGEVRERVSPFVCAQTQFISRSGVKEAKKVLASNLCSGIGRHLLVNLSFWFRRLESTRRRWRKRFTDPSRYLQGLRRNILANKLSRLPFHHARACACLVLPPLPGLSAAPLGLIYDLEDVRPCNLMNPMCSTVP